MKKLTNMAYNKFNINIILQVIFLAITPVLFLWAISKDYMLFTSVSLAFIWLFQIGCLIFYLNKVNRELSRFLLAFKYQDSTLIFKPKSKDTSFKNLYHNFNSILEAFGKVKLEKERDFIFFQNAIEHVGIGLLAFDGEGNVRLCNKATKKLFRLHNIKNINTLNKVSESFSNSVRNVKPGRRELVKLLLNNEVIQLSINSSEFVMDEHKIKLVSFQDIKGEIEQQEMDAWQKLIRVFSHEILNSVSPISLLSASLINLFKNGDEPVKPDMLEYQTIQDTLMGLHTINKRSKGLAKFVENYRSLTQIPPLNISSFYIKDLFNQIETLYKEELNSNKISFSTWIQSEKIQLIADEKLIEQVIINLIKNSIQAFDNQESPKIKLTAFRENNETIIQVIDNGKGIPTEILEHIFMPFFTTKEKGSGIGLSISRQIMRLHKGSVSVHSKINDATMISLVF